MKVLQSNKTTCMFPRPIMEINILNKKLSSFININFLFFYRNVYILL